MKSGLNCNSVTVELPQCDVYMMYVDVYMYIHVRVRLWMVGGELNCHILHIL